GNTGNSLAMVCAQKGYPLVVTMAENFSIEQRKLMRYLGATVVLTPAAEKTTGMVAKAKELAAKHGWFWCRQFENEANCDVHSRVTAREILDAFSKRGLDYWVTGFGTGGTLNGVARVLKQESPNTIVVASEPSNSPLLASGIAQHYQADGTPAQSHAAFQFHRVRGWSPDFLPKLANDARGQKLVERIVPVNARQAFRVARQLARQEGIFCGISSGATFAAALEVAQTAPDGASILAMLPDFGGRALTAALFEDFNAEMSLCESEILHQVPSISRDFTAPGRQITPLSRTQTKPDHTGMTRRIHKSHSR
ncbi:MAG: PLP-dependent cysteine synthase family protein, partial [Alphaproteobacteria bacterium]